MKYISDKIFDPEDLSKLASITDPNPQTVKDHCC
ncbi:hypothetical protein X926_05035 [Petrotoga sp. HWHPT.55.6.3]|nr:hypothetical protein X926_05035 [Petrotoga sp. HWHPT.55.6.3]